MHLTPRFAGVFLLALVANAAEIIIAGKGQEPALLEPRSESDDEIPVERELFPSRAIIVRLLTRSVVESDRGTSHAPGGELIDEPECMLEIRPGKTGTIAPGIVEAVDEGSAHP